MKMEEILTKMGLLLDERVVDLEYGKNFSYAGALTTDGKGNYFVGGRAIPLNDIDSIESFDDPFIPRGLIKVRNGPQFPSGNGR